MRVLLGADGSAHGTAALRPAFRVLSAADRSVDILCVAPRVHPKKSGLQGRLERHAARIADRVVQSLAKDGVPAKGMVRAGSPTRALIGCSQNYDVVVVSAQSHKGPSVGGLGPVASRLLEHADTSVFLARGGDVGSPAKILIPVDGSDIGVRALEKLKDLLDLNGSEVTLLHVVETPWIRPVDDQEWIATEEERDQEPQSELEQEFTQEAETLLEQARAKLGGVTSSTMIYHGIPAEEILTEANSGGYDVVVLAATGERDLKHRILGSVSSKVAWNAPCSVLLIHQE
jgi:nucleotide-binding universal stress UspA family protein